MRNGYYTPKTVEEIGNMTIVGNGVDIIEVKRIKNAINRYNQSFLERIFTPLEISNFKKYTGEFLTGFTDKELKNAKEHNGFYQHLAGRFAVKEAVLKALGKVKLSFKDIEVLNDSAGRPHCSLLSNNQNNFNIYISISHIKNYAVASAIITQKTSDS